VTNVEYGISMLHCLNKPFNKMTNQLTHLDTKIVELVDDGLHTLNKRRISILKEIKKSYGIKFTVHAPFADVNISSPSKPLRNFMIKRLKRSMHFAKSLDAKLWVLHPGIKTGISMFYPGEDWKQNKKTIELLDNHAKKLDIQIAIENLPKKYGFIMNTPEDFKRFYAESPSNDIGIVLDTGHSNLEGQTESFLRQLSEKILHIHISDNNGEDDQHLGLGKGNIDWSLFAKILSEIKYRKTIMIETVENVNESLNKIQKLLNY